MNRTVRDLLQMKSFGVVAIDATASVYEAAEMMRERSIGALLVRDNRTTVGLISERDLVHHLAANGKDALTAAVTEVMTRDPVHVGLDDTIRRCMELMTDRRVRHLIVRSEEQRVAGLVSIGDVVKALIDDQAFVIDQLENYITGRIAAGRPAAPLALA